MKLPTVEFKRGETLDAICDRWKKEIGPIITLFEPEACKMIMDVIPKQAEIMMQTQLRNWTENYECVETIAGHTLPFVMYV